MQIKEKSSSPGPNKNVLHMDDKHRHECVVHLDGVCSMYPYLIHFEPFH